MPHLKSAQAAAGACILLVLVVGVAAFFSVDVCNQELTDAGRPVSVCRHLEMTDPPSVVLGLVLLGALGAFFTEVSGFGISLKREVHDAKSAAEAAKAAVETVKEDTGDLAEGVRHALSRGGPADPAVSNAAGARVAELANAYNTIRWTMPSGVKRTSAMGSIVDQMIEEVRSAEDFDVDVALASDNRGLRLAGYAYLFTHPRSEHAAALASAIASEDKPFNQYWGLKALAETVRGDPHGLDPDSRRLLVEMLRDIGPSTDRGRILQAILGT